MVAANNYVLKMMGLVKQRNVQDMVEQDKTIQKAGKFKNRISSKDDDAVILSLLDQNIAYNISLYIYSRAFGQ